MLSVRRQFSQSIKNVPTEELFRIRRAKGQLPGPMVALRSTATRPPQVGPKATQEVRQCPPTLPSTTSVLTAATFVYTAGAGITAAAGTRLALRLILTERFEQHPLLTVPTRCGHCCHSSSLPHKRVCNGQFTRLLPALAVVAIFQAPSPGSDPHPPLPVKAIVVHDTTIAADRTGFHPVTQPPCGVLLSLYGNVNLTHQREMLPGQRPWRWS
jgi:hypothetical protein